LRGEPFELHDDYARIAESWDLALLPVAHACPSADAGCIRAELERRFAEEKLGRELDAVRGDFARARSVLKLRVQRGPAAISAPIAGDLHAALVLDLPSFVTPVRPADLAAWEKPAPELIGIAVENVKGQEHVELNPMEIAGTRIYAVSGKSVFVATLGWRRTSCSGNRLRSARWWPCRAGTFCCVTRSRIAGPCERSRRWRPARCRPSRPARRLCRRT